MYVVVQSVSARASGCSVVGVVDVREWVCLVSHSLLLGGVLAGYQPDKPRLRPRRSHPPGTTPDHSRYHPGTRALLLAGLVSLPLEVGCCTRWRRYGCIFSTTQSCDCTSTGGSTPQAAMLRLPSSRADSSNPKRELMAGLALLPTLSVCTRRHGKPRWPPAHHLMDRHTAPGRPQGERVFVRGKRGQRLTGQKVGQCALSMAAFPCARYELYSVRRTYDDDQVQAKDRRRNMHPIPPFPPRCYQDAPLPWHGLGIGGVT